MYHRILVGFDGSSAAQRALEAAATLALEQDARLLVVGVEEPLPSFPGTIDEVAEMESLRTRHWEAVRRKAITILNGLGLEPEGIDVVGNPADGLIRAAKDHGVDLLVVGACGHSRFFHPFMGSTADRVVEHAPCSVLVVR